MKNHCPTPSPNEKRHRLLVAAGDDAVDQSDITLATLSHFDGQYLRTAQVSARIEDSRMLIQHLQGAGPCRSYRMAGAGDPKRLFEKFRKDVGLKPINTLLATLVLEAKELGMDEAVWDGSDEFDLKPDAILQATQFRRDARGQFRLPLRTPNEQIVKRLVGRDSEKAAVFEAIREKFRQLLKPLRGVLQTDHG